jgi:hypothetical protein
MPILITNDKRTPVIQIPGTPGICVKSYQDYVSQRVDSLDTHENITQLTEDYKSKVVEPLKAINANIVVGEYFVIPVPELRRMLDSADQPDFVHICNAVRDAKNQNNETITFPVSILVPIKKVDINGEEAHAVCKSNTSIYLEAFPCPPHPNCPHTSSLLQNIFKPNTILNNFSSLL